MTGRMTGGPYERRDPHPCPEREKVRFSSGGSECVAWHDPGATAPAIMAGGFAVTKEPGTDLFARRFHDAGFGVLAFDYRGFGESGGRPRQVASVGGQLTDWRAAVAFAATLPQFYCRPRSGGSPHPPVTSSGSGAHPAPRRGDRPDAERRGPGRRTPRGAPPEAHSPCCARRRRGVLDEAGPGLLGSSAPLVPHSAGQPYVAVLTTPDTADTPRALNPDNRYPDWRQEVAARSALGLGFIVPAVTPPAYGVRCSSSYASRTSPPRPRRPCARRGGAPRGAGVVARRA